MELRYTKRLMPTVGGGHGQRATDIDIERVKVRGSMRPRAVVGDGGEMHDGVDASEPRPPIGDRGEITDRVHLPHAGDGHAARTSGYHFHALRGQRPTQRTTDETIRTGHQHTPHTRRRRPRR